MVQTSPLSEQVRDEEGKNEWRKWSGGVGGGRDGWEKIWTVSIHLRVDRGIIGWTDNGLSSLLTFTSPLVKEQEELYQLLSLRRSEIKCGRAAFD